MSPLRNEITRRTALAAMGTSAMGLMIPPFSLATEEGSDLLAKVLPKFSEKSRAALRHLLSTPNYSGQIPPGVVAELLQNEKNSVEKLMVDLIPLAQGYSQAPISNFHVGVVVRGASEALYTGANIEIPGQSLGFAVHAEQSALSNAYMHSESGVTALAVGGAPCGHCRQFINEMVPDGEIQILTPDKPPTKLSAILPAAFGPAALGMTHGAFPIPFTSLAPGGFSGGSPTHEALHAAIHSYAPYSKSPSGVALRTSSHRIYRGSYIENVAFNPSLSPLQVALAAMIAGGEPYSAIEAVTLVEVEAATISQRAVTETVLRAVAPSVKLVVVTTHA